MADIKKDSLPWENQGLTSSNGNGLDVIGMLKLEKDKPRLLLHSCCGPCSTAVIERLLPDYDITVFFYNPNITDSNEYEKRLTSQLMVIDYFNKNLSPENKIELLPDYDITVFFYNPNITDSNEYEKRLTSQLMVIDYFNKNLSPENKIDFIEGRYDPDEYFKLVSGYEEEKEGGRRCSLCFDMRLEETAIIAKEKGFDTFTTTLTVSPHKSYDIISQIGKSLSEKYKVEYLDGNFKKKDGFKRSIELSKEMNLYRQNYCGCQFSVWEK